MKDTMGSGHSGGSSIGSEKDFLTEMTKHHEAAVKMAKAVLALDNVQARTGELARAIIKAQSTEIRLMEGLMKTADVPTSRGH